MIFEKKRESKRRRRVWLWLVSCWQQLPTTCTFPSQMSHELIQCDPWYQFVLSENHGEEKVALVARVSGSRREKVRERWQEVRKTWSVSARIVLERTFGLFWGKEKEMMERKAIIMVLNTSCHWYSVRWDSNECLKSVSSRLKEEKERKRNEAVKERGGMMWPVHELVHVLIEMLQGKGRKKEEEDRFGREKDVHVEIPDVLINLLPSHRERERERMREKERKVN